MDLACLYVFGLHPVLWPHSGTCPLSGPSKKAKLFLLTCPVSTLLPQACQAN